MSEQSNESYEITQLCLLAGKIMLQSGGETNRVEDTMIRIAASYGFENCHSFVTPTGIIFAIDGSAPITRLYRISERSTDLKKVTLVNDISRKISSGNLSYAEAYRLLKKIEVSNLAYPVWLQIAAAMLSSGCFTIMFRGGWPEFVPSLLAGGLGFSFFLYFHRLSRIKFFSEFLASIVVGTVSYFCVRFGLGRDLDKVIIGSVMPLVPGLLITNAVRDLMAGHLVSGISKGAEAFLTAFAIGAGVACVLSFA
ncbi:threonine/serine exporter family protein [Paenibacillus alvei]|uniref:threonine/serine exporter family protein n=1 Tax=Paenibacillus alvei TaxID=44250 RepID=UPI0018CD07F2|nr:threonine/serine exporter family protein [Paenibacillus alvei]MBG9735247.1 membrane protein [Paenibacillus alvei]MBG9743704.1 membrane protein [Paenibacillus alvei]MCY9580128.1 threonine/serine exporter family protein [Paenibacillus alvei]MCY9584303.1 threonine/serine exporter family protein [Paenibacillus alvei]